MFYIISDIILVLAQTIAPLTHIISYAFCPFIFGGVAIYAIIKWVKLDKSKIREIWWSVSVIILAFFVIVFVGLNTFVWLNDFLFYFFIAIRFSLFVFLILLANPYIKWSPFKKIFMTKNQS